MPRILNSVPVASITISDHNLTIAQIVSIVRLIVINKAFPFDLHPNNQLYVGTTNQIVIIDFGKTSGVIPSDDNNSYIDNSDKTELYGLITSNYEPRLFALSRQFESNKGNTDAAAISRMESDICEYMSNVLVWIKGVEDMCIRKRLDKLHHQGMSYVDDKYFKMKKFIDDIVNMSDGRAKCGLLMESFKKISDSIQVTNRAISKSSIDTVISEGRIIGFHGVNASNFECSSIPDRIGNFPINKVEPPTNTPGASAASNANGSSPSTSISTPTPTNTNTITNTSSDSTTSTGSSGYFSSSASNSEPTINYLDAERGYGWGGGARKQSRRKQSRRKQSRRKQSRRKQSKKRRRTSKK